MKPDRDELKPEYDLRRLRVRQLGPGRKSFGSEIVKLEADVAKAFPSAGAVNKALRSLMFKGTKPHKRAA